MRKWQRNRVLAGFGCLLVLLGVGPLALAILQLSQSQPLSVPVLLKRGEYKSAYFRTYLGGEYQIELSWLRIPPDVDADLDLDWKIVDSGGRIIQQGTHNNRLLGNDVLLGYYKARFGQRQRIILTVRRDVEGNRAHAQLDIGQPELGLDMSYGFFILTGWAVIVGGPGVILLCVLLILRAKRMKTSAPSA